MLQQPVAERADPRNRQAGRISASTLERWALVREIAELEEALADSFHRADRETACAWTEAVRRDVESKRAALQALSHRAARR